MCCFFAFSIANILHVLVSLNHGKNQPEKSDIAVSIADESASPVKFNLDYLKKQQAIISTAVGNAAVGIKENCSSVSSSKNNPTIDHKRQNTKLFTRQHIIVPVSRFKIVKSASDVQVCSLKSISDCKSHTSNEVVPSQNLNFAVVSTPSQQTASTFQVIAAKNHSSDCRPLPAEKLVHNQLNSKSVKMLINPSNARARLSAFTPQDQQTPQKPQTVKLFKVQLTGKSAVMQPTPTLNAQNFVKLDFPSLAQAKSSVPSTTAIKKVQNRGGKPLTRRNSSVVTNLVTRLEKQGYSTSDDSALLKRPALDVVSNLPGYLPKVSSACLNVPIYIRLYLLIIRQNLFTYMTSLSFSSILDLLDLSRHHLFLSNVNSLGTLLYLQSLCSRMLASFILMYVVFYINIIRNFLILSN